MFNNHSETGNNLANQKKKTSFFAPKDNKNKDLESSNQFSILYDSMSNFPNKPKKKGARKTKAKYAPETNHKQMLKVKKMK